MMRESDQSGPGLSPGQRDGLVPVSEADERWWGKRVGTWSEWGYG
jgi:hypothetical protein